MPVRQESNAGASGAAGRTTTPATDPPAAAAAPVTAALSARRRSVRCQTSAVGSVPWDIGTYGTPENAASAHDLHSTLLNLLVIHRKQLVHRALGHDYRLTDVSGELVTGIKA